MYSTYDSSLNQCVVTSSEGFTTESYVNNVLTKTQSNKNGRTDVDLREPRPSNM